MFDNLLEAADGLVLKAKANNAILATAESCTGGMVAMAITSVAGSSTVFDRSYVTYSNMAKSEMIDVPFELIQENGAVSPQVAISMANNALKKSSANIVVSITGIAGPSGGSDTKPVGLVYFGLAKKGHLTRSFEKIFTDTGRNNIRIEASLFALSLFSRAMD